MHKKTVRVIIINNDVLTECNKYLVYNGFIVFMLSRRDTASQQGKGCNISVTRLRCSTNHNSLDIWPIRAHLASQNMSFVTINAFQKGGATIMYSMWKMCFLNLEPQKHIALHQIHKLIIFLTTSYDLFKNLRMKYKCIFCRNDSMSSMSEPAMTESHNTVSLDNRSKCFEIMVCTFFFFELSVWSQSH